MISNTPSLHSHFYGSLWKTYLYYGSLIYLLIDVTDGALRYFLATHGLEIVLYLRDVFACSAVVGVFFLGLWRGRVQKVTLCLMAILLVWGIVGFVIFGNILQILFGAKYFLPTFLGIAVAPLFLHRSPKTTFLIFLLWLIAVVGLLWAMQTEFPWEGFHYDVAGFNIQGNRKWDVDDVRRLSGFSRASSQVSGQLVILGAYLLCFSESMLLRITIWIFSGYGIFLTTTRSAFIAYGALTLLWLSYFTLKSKFFEKLLMLGVLGVMIGLPLLSPTNFRLVDSMDQGGVISTSSFSDRTKIVWPAALKLISEHGTVLTGRGVGGISNAQKYFEWNNYNPADNLFLFLLGTFGLFSLLFLFIIIFRLLRINIHHSSRNAFAFAMGLTFFAIGITLDSTGFAMLTFFFGIMLGGVWK